MDPNQQRLWRKCNALLSGYRSYYLLAGQRLDDQLLDHSEQELVDQNYRLYGQYLRRLERMHIDLCNMHNQGAKKPTKETSTQKQSQTTTSAMEAELDGMVGRLRVEVQAIVGFARLNQGDVFEVSLRHGQQKWKTRGKTQPDRTQRWDSNTHQFTCYPDQPLVVKVVEVRMIRSKVLSERAFDPTKFFAPQPLLVTMNLNSIGSLKLKMVISWLPLMTSKTLAPLPPQEEAKKLAEHRHTSTLSTSSLANTINTTNADDSHKHDGTLTNSPRDVSPPRICLRDKKRSGKLGAANKDLGNWRSSTTILDSVYKDLSKSIPTIDDLTAFGSSTHVSQPPHHSKMRSDSTHASVAKSGRGPQMGVQALRSQHDALRSISMHHLAGDARSEEEEDKERKQISRSTVYGVEPNQQRVPNGSGFVAPNGQESVVVEMRGRKSTDSDDSSGVSSLGANGSVGKRSRLATCERVDSLLQLIDRLRGQLSPLRASEFSELAAFEAAMLNWEASLKLNRALFVENSRSTNVSTRRNQMAANRLAKRTSLYSVHHQQPSPPSTLSSEDSNERNGTVGVNGDHIFENDSGIDSLRQPISPYNRHRPFPSSMSGSLHLGTGGRSTNSSASIVTGPAQRRFNKHMQERRRRSLGGWILDDPMECERWLEALGQSAANGESMGKMHAATGHPELDLCLQHHLANALACVEELAQLHGPLEYRTNELLNRVDQNTVAMEEMLRIADALPSWPNVTNLLSDLGADWDQQEVWLSTCYAQNASIVVPAERLRVNLHSAVAPIVKKAQYPQLIVRVVDTLMHNLQPDQTPHSNQCVSVFEFGAHFAGKQFGSYVESLAHEAFITTSLESQHVGAVREIMERLRQVPIVPPMESLRHIGLVLHAMNGGEAITAIERYFRSASNELQHDLAAAFVNLLESKDARTRAGACKALAILKNEQCMDALGYLANEDLTPMVRQEAKRAYERIHHFYSEYQEITKI